jgi:hypothetical protein
MAHCPFQKLGDIAEALDEIRTLPSVREPKPGIFYLKSKPFLHFHEKDGKRWADIRDDDDWGDPVDLPFGPSRLQVERFIKAARYRHAGLLEKRKP